MRCFELHRVEDVSGVSGTGVVAQGVEFDDGCVALRWLTEWPTSVVFHDRGADAVEHVHGHNGRTRIVWLPTRPHNRTPTMRKPTNYDDLLDRIDAWCDAVDTGHELLGRELLYATWRIVEALTARPDAELEQVGWYTPGMAGGPNIGSLFDGKFSGDDEPLYRLRAAAADPTPPPETP